MGLIDTTFKEMAKSSFPELLRYLMPELLPEGGEVVELPQELPATVRSVDLMLKAMQWGVARRLAILECQVGADPELHRRMLLRAGLATFFYGLPTATLLLAMTPAAAVEPRFTFAYVGDDPVDYAVKVRRLYEEPAEDALLRAPAALLPLCPVMQPAGGDRCALLEQTLLKIAQLDLDPERRRLLMTWASTFATLHLTSVQVQLVYNDLQRRRPHMLNPLRDFPLLRDTFQEGRTEGKAEDLLVVVTERGLPVSEEQRQRVLACRDVQLLLTWLKRSLKARSMDEVLA